MSDSPHQFVLASLALKVPGSERHGRVFLPADQVKSFDLQELGTALARRFVEQDDEARLVLLERALQAPAITVETYPGEEVPVELHAYVRAPTISSAPIFACVLATDSVVQQLLETAPHVVFETASFQEIGTEATAVAIKAGLNAWVSRVFPETLAPKFELSQWPETKLTELEPTPKIRLGSGRMKGAKQFLSAKDFPTAEECRQL